MFEKTRKFIGQRFFGNDDIHAELDAAEKDLAATPQGPCTPLLPQDGAVRAFEDDCQKAESILGPLPWCKLGRAAIASLRAENARLQAIIDKLPKTADGVPITPGMTVWVPKHAEGENNEWMDAEVLVAGIINYNACGCDGDGQEAFMGVQDDCHPDCDRATDAKRAYADEAAAKAARGGK